MNNVVVRKGDYNDIDAICGMQKQWLEEDITYGFVPNSREELIKRVGPYFLVADVDRCIVGFVLASIHVSKGSAVIPAGQQYLEIDDIYVRPEFRNSGIGGKVLDRLIHTAQHHGIERFMVYSATKDLDKILGFYRKHGFKSWCIQMFR